MKGFFATFLWILCGLLWTLFGIKLFDMIIVLVNMPSTLAVFLGILFGALYLQTTWAGIKGFLRFYHLLN